jgi:tetratricopeptide (TPR) repeat protein
MEEITLKELDSRLHKQIDNARKALDKNPSYAMDILSNIVARNPNCLEAREILRQAQQKANKGKSKGLGKFMSKVTSIPFSMGSDAKVKKDPAKAMETAEQMLNSNPENVSALKMLGAAADALKLYGTAAFAYNSIYKIDPKDVESIKALMGAYIAAGKTQEAIQIGDIAYRLNPTDDEIQGLVKKASVEQSINKGKWEDDKTFRDKLKDEEGSNKLEQAGRAKTGEAGLRSLIEDAIKSVEEEPDNLNFYRDIVNNYKKLGEYDSALEWLGKARQLESGKADVNLERLESSLKREKMQKAIAEKEEELEAAPEDAAIQAELEKLRGEEAEFRLEQTENLVNRYPNEFSYRFELGQLYFENGEIDKAIKELQLGQRSAKVRISALVILGKAYKQKGFFDLAAEQLVTAKSEIPGVTEEKKDVLYELGSCYEQQGDMEKAIAEYKTLYGADISYRDVSKKIDDFYSNK